MNETVEYDKVSMIWEQLEKKVHVTINTVSSKAAAFLHLYNCNLKTFQKEGRFDSEPLWYWL